ncbi:hypothetical protein [Nocardioides sp. WS12]|uniref:hypothetical protein n=1 Tax=Nocardioides sp. WS12 TaxID=2486272 RepID=UPI0015FCCFAA|nr:hypothetical protein [Nocardioides sp. WS12]
MADQPPNWQAYQPRHDDTRGVGPTPTPTSPYSNAGTFTTYNAPAERRRVRRRIGLLLAGAAVVVGGAGAGVWAVVEAVNDSDRPTTTTTTTRTVTESEAEVQVSGSGTVELFTTAGVADLAAALREETGSTRVFEVAMFRNIAVVTVPDKDAPDGARVYQWDGTLTSLTESMSVRKPFDFTEVKGNVLARLCGGVLETCTVVIGRPFAGDRAWLTVVGSGGGKRTDLSGNPV